MTTIDKLRIGISDALHQSVQSKQDLETLLKILLPPENRLTTCNAFTELFRRIQIEFFPLSASAFQVRKWVFRENTQEGAKRLLV